MEDRNSSYNSRIDNVENTVENTKTHTPHTHTHTHTQALCVPCTFKRNHFLVKKTNTPLITHYINGTAGICAVALQMSYKVEPGLENVFTD